MNPSTVALEVVGGLVLFLFGVLQLSRGIEPLAGERARELLSRFTTNPLAGVPTGAVATTILDSSSVTIILVIALVNGGLLTFQQSLGVILGSNIGTTVSSQIFAFDLEVYSPLVLLAGFLLFITSGVRAVAATSACRCSDWGWCSSVCTTWARRCGRCATTAASCAG